MGCQLRAHAEEYQSHLRNQLNWSSSSYWVMKVTEPYTPNTEENFEFNNPYYPDVPTYQHRIPAEAFKIVDSILPKDYENLAPELKTITKDQFDYAREFISYCAEHKVGCSCSH